MRPGCRDTSFRTAQAVDRPRRNLSGTSAFEPSAYVHRSIVRTTSVVSLSNTSAAAWPSSCPVTGPSPSGSGDHTILSDECSLAEADPVVARAPPGAAGSTKITYPRPEPHIAWTCSGRAFADFATQKVRPTVLAQIIHEGIGANLDRMTNDQFPMTKRAGSAAHTVTVSPNRRICHWSFAIGIWSFPQDSRAVFANNAG